MGCCDSYLVARLRAGYTCVVACVALLWAAASSAETTTFKYDALGRLTHVDIAGGAMDGVRRTFQYDPAGNRTASNTRSWVPTPIKPTSTTLVFMGTSDVVLTATIGDSGTGGTVSFWVNESFAGTTQVVNGVATIRFQQMAPGTYTVRAEYSGDAQHVANTFTFTAKVQNLSWLPALLDLILQ
jgi:hypothetical protein